MEEIQALLNANNYNIRITVYRLCDLHGEDVLELDSLHELQAFAEFLEDESDTGGHTRGEEWDSTGTEVPSW